jgi:hypothetical protein
MANNHIHNRRLAGLFPLLSFCFVFSSSALAAPPQTAPITQNSPASGLQAVPSASAQAASLKIVKELFKPYPPERPEDKIKLAERLMVEATAASPNDLATIYVLLRESQEMSASGGDVDSALRKIDQIAQRFAIDAPSEKLATLTRARTLRLTPTAANSYAEATLQVGDIFMHRGDFESAGRAAALATALVQKKQDAKIASAAQSLAADARKGHAEATIAKLADDKLKTQPADAAANLTVGRFMCFWLGDWTHGLPHLALGSDVEIKTAAAADIAAPTDSISQFQLAEKWYALTAREAGVPLAHIRQRAARWYRHAQPELKGLEKILAEKRIAEAGALEDDPGVVGEAETALTRLLNDPTHWIVKHGTWKNEAGKLRGEGDTEISFDTPLPRNITFCFHLNVIDGMRPRMFFDGTAMKLCNEGYTQNLFPYDANNADKDFHFPYKNNEPHLLLFRFSGDQFIIDIDNKPAFGGRLKGKDETTRLRFRGGDFWSPGTTEFYGFQVISLPKPPTTAPAK